MHIASTVQTMEPARLGCSGLAVGPVVPVPQQGSIITIHIGQDMLSAATTMLSRFARTSLAANSLDMALSPL